MQKLIFIFLLLAVTAANSECFQRKEILSTGGLPIDNQRESYVRLSKNQFKCTYSFRVLVDGTWTWAEKNGEGNTAIKACLAAREAASTWLMTNTPEYDVSVQQNVETICDSSKKIPNVVRIGQEVNLSDLTIDPKFFNTDGSIRFVRPVDASDLTCSIFLENQIRSDGVAIQNKGYVCQTGHTWTVWKKWEQSRIDK
jgi:hypothetical protein